MTPSEIRKNIKARRNREYQQKKQHLAKEEKRKEAEAKASLETRIKELEEKESQRKTKNAQANREHYRRNKARKMSASNPPTPASSRRQGDIPPTPGSGYVMPFPAGLGSGVTGGMAGASPVVSRTYPLAAATPGMAPLNDAVGNMLETLLRDCPQEEVDATIDIVTHAGEYHASINRVQQLATAASGNVSKIQSMNADAQQTARAAILGVNQSQQHMTVYLEQEQKKTTAALQGMAQAARTLSASRKKKQKKRPDCSNTPGKLAADIGATELFYGFGGGMGDASVGDDTHQGDCVVISESHSDNAKKPAAEKVAAAGKSKSPPAAPKLKDPPPSLTNMQAAATPSKSGRPPMQTARSKPSIIPSSHATGTAASSAKKASTEAASSKCKSEQLAPTDAAVPTNEVMKFKRKSEEPSTAKNDNKRPKSDGQENMPSAKMPSATTDLVNVAVESSSSEVGFNKNQAPTATSSYLSRGFEKLGGIWGGKKNNDDSAKNRKAPPELASDTVNDGPAKMVPHIEKQCMASTGSIPEAVLEVVGKDTVSGSSYRNEHRVFSFLHNGRLHAFYMNASGSAMLVPIKGDGFQCEKCPKEDGTYCGIHSRRGKKPVPLASLVGPVEEASLIRQLQEIIDSGEDGVPNASDTTLGTAGKPTVSDSKPAASISRRDKKDRQVSDLDGAPPFQVAAAPVAVTNGPPAVASNSSLTVSKKKHHQIKQWKRAVIDGTTKKKRLEAVKHLTFVANKPAARATVEKEIRDIVIQTTGDIKEAAESALAKIRIFGWRDTALSESSTEEGKLLALEKLETEVIDGTNKEIQEDALESIILISEESSGAVMAAATSFVDGISELD